MKRHEKYQRLRVLRAERHWTQWYLSSKAQVPQSRISLFENGYADPTDKERVKLARAFQLPEQDVFPSVEAVA